MDATSKLAWSSLLAGAFLLGPHPVNPIAGSAVPSNSAQPEAEAPISSVEVKSFAIKEADMQEALRTLRADDVTRIVIGFERILHREGEEDKRISLELRNTTVGEILRRLCEADRRYEYEVVNGQVVEIRPKGAKNHPNDLLNIRIREYSVDRNQLPDGAIVLINQDAPELREFLRCKAAEWIRKTGKYPGYPGSNLSGNMPLPGFRMHLRNVTVREILDAIALYSVRLFKEGKTYGPVGWEYDFVIDPDAPTGVGGTPKWSAF